MTDRRRRKAGTPCWATLVSPDPSASAPYYESLFGWSWAEPGAGFAMLRLDGADVAGLIEMPVEARGGAASRWLVYLATDQVGKTLDAIAAAGGSVLAPAFTVPGAGRMAVAADPLGAEFGLWEAEGHPGATLVGAPGSLTWAELATHGRAAAAGFYERVFGWIVEEVQAGAESFVTCSLDGEPVCGMFPLSAAWSSTPSHWTPYFAVVDCDDAARRAVAHGGEVPGAPRTTGSGRVAVLRDPQGALFRVADQAPSG